MNLEVAWLMKQYIRTGERTYSNDYLSNVIKSPIPNLQSQNLNTEWVGFSLHIIDDLATDFNLYMFFNETMPNMPAKFLFTQFGESIFDLCKLIDNRRNNKVSLLHILNSIEQNIIVEVFKNGFKKFKNDVVLWLESKKDFVQNLCTVRDKFLAHIDIYEKSQNEYRSAFRKILVHDFIEISNTIIQIYAEIITSIMAVCLPESYYMIDEFNFIYECLRSLDKIDKNATVKNLIIHNIDLELNQIKELIK